VCFFWGTTYLGIRVALESFSPALLMCLRYSLSGGVLLIGALLAGARFPNARDLRWTALYGVITIGLGTGSLAFSEQWVASGLASLLVGTQPFWMVGVEAWMPGGERLHLPSIWGMAVGLAGVALLIAPSLMNGGSLQGGGSKAILGGFLLLQFGAMMWAWGSVAQRRLGGRTHPFVSGGIQQLATGLAFAIPAFLGPRHAIWDSKGIAAILYLAVFGGIVGYSAFIYSMHHLPVALVSIYTYINPIVAVALGWWFYREPFGWPEAVGMAIVFAGVALVKRASHTSAQRPQPPPAEETSVPIE
jgi:drug/metabolite transporter (DMT)-like permease